MGNMKWRWLYSMVSISTSTSDAMSCISWRKGFDHFFEVLVEKCFSFEISRKCMIFAHKTFLTPCLLYWPVWCSFFVFGCLNFVNPLYWKSSWVILIHYTLLPHNKYSSSDHKYSHRREPTIYLFSYFWPIFVSSLIR